VGEQQDGSGDDTASSVAGKDAGAHNLKNLTTTLKTARSTLRPMVVIEGGRKLLRVGGVIQSVHVDDAYEADIWDAMLPRERPENVLILGLGGGTMAQLLSARFGPLPITGVERDPAVIWLARHEFGLAHLPNVRIVEEDAFAFVRRAAARQGIWKSKDPSTTRDAEYDTICVDLYTAGKMAHGVFDPIFLRALARILTRGGTSTFNLWRSPYLADQLRRIERTFVVRELLEVGENLVARCSHPGAEE
jgi:spermidine synthase